MARPNVFMVNDKDDERLVAWKDIKKFEEKGYSVVCEENERVPEQETPVKVVEVQKAPVVETGEVKPLGSVEQMRQDNIEKDTAPDMETKEQPKEVKEKPKKGKKGEVPKDRKCPHCGVVARTDDSYKRNHGDKCLRAHAK